MSTTSHVADRLSASIAATGSIACVGLDPRPELLPPTLRAKHGAGPQSVADAFVEFNHAVISAVAGQCAAVKPQAACYEAYGAAGWDALERTVALARDAGIPVIADAKRGDLGSTALHYQQAFFGGAPDLHGDTHGGMQVDWLTTHGYLGADTINSQSADGGGLFVLVKTSNPTSVDLQDTPSGDRTVSATMADLVHTWGAERLGACGLSSIGAVVGATFPTEAAELRTLMPNTVFLVPGYGAQGGTAADAIAGRRPAAGSSESAGLLVSSSRGIIGAWRSAETDDWAGAARDALASMNRALDNAMDGLER